MNIRLLSAFTILLLSLGATNLYSAATDAAVSDTAPAAASLPAPAAEEKPDPAVVADLNDLITRINVKINQDKMSETDYADNLKEFDNLLIKHQKAPVEARVQILLQKAILYMEVLRLPEKALPVFQQIKKDFPSIQISGSTDEVIAEVQEQADKKKIRDALVDVSFPDFSEKDLGGNALSISKYKGKVVLLDFWATWCPPCVASVPEIQKVYDKYHSKGFEVVGVSLDDEKGDLEKFVKQRKLPWPQVFAGQRFDNKLAVKYGVAFAPTTFLIGKDGKVIKQLLNGRDDLDKEVAAALK